MGKDELMMNFRGERTLWIMDFLLRMNDGKDVYEIFDFEFRNKYYLYIYIFKLIFTSEIVFKKKFIIRTTPYDFERSIRRQRDSISFFL